MNGLLDYGRIDPLALGLLGAGGALMTPRAMGGGVPAALSQFSGGMLQGQQLLRQQALDQQRQRMLEQEMAMRQQEFDLRRDETTRKRATEDALRNAARRAIVPGTVAAGPTMDEPGTAATPTRLDSERFISELAQVAPMEAAAMLRPQKQESPYGKIDIEKFTPASLRAFQQTGDPSVLELRPQQEKPSEPTQIARLMAEMGALPPNDPRRAIYEDAIRKATTTAPAAVTNVMTGTMVPVETPDGRPAFVMPGRDGSVVQIPDVQPPGTKKTDDAAKAKVSAQVNDARRIIGKVDEALANINRFTTGTVGRTLSMVPGTSAVDLRESIETIRANLGFQQLQAMRDASPTGGALGAIAVQELNALQAVVSSLNPNQSDDALRRNLGQIRQHYTNWLSAIQGVPRSGATGNAPGSQPPAVGNGWSIRREK